MNKKLIKNKNIISIKNNKMSKKETTIKQDTGLKRDTIDKYYTKLDIVEDCKVQIEKHINIKENDLIIEPSAGNGSFIKIIKELTKNHKFYDLIPENKEIIKQDFLLLDVDKIIEPYKKIHIIGNPPFGRQSSLAIQFIKKCCEFADTISFILPKSFKKDSNKAKFDKFFHLIYEKDLPENSFSVNGDDCNVPCVFQIWKKKKTERIIPDKIEPKNFKFVDKTEHHDISFRRVGVYAGKIDKETNDKSIQSHYFIKFTNNKSVNDNIKLLEKINFDFNNTVGPKSINKQELIKEFNKYI
jgi:predicted RNA methylase